MSRTASLCLCLVFALLAAAPARAQELKTQPTPFSAWLDLRPVMRDTPSKSGLPIWIESVQRIVGPRKEHIVRLRLRQFGALNEFLSLRLFFVDVPGSAPIVHGWTETGSQPFTSNPLGSGVGVETSESVLVPAAGLDYIDIETPGDNSHLRGLFITSARKGTLWHSFDFATVPDWLDPFGRPAAAAVSEDDLLLFGRVRAVIDTQPYKLTPPGQVEAVYEFALDSKPLLASVTFEVLGANPLQPIHAYLGQHLLGPLSIQFPDLADPGFRGASRPYQGQMDFQYTGWLRAQIVVPGSRLNAGLNTLTLRVNAGGEPIVLRAVEIELKHPSPVFHYELKR